VRQPGGLTSQSGYPARRRDRAGVRGAHGRHAKVWRDVLAPSSDSTGVAVYQVKSFTSNLTQGQKAQAERYFRRLMDHAAGSTCGVVSDPAPLSYT
jgi:hypothetical protein